MKGRARLAGLALLALAAAKPAAAQEDPWGECLRAIAAAEPGANLPQGLLLAIATVESGRRHPDTGQLRPWPWSWNAGGESGYAETRAEAAAAINALLEGGQRSIDVGCMQVNLMHHPDAFAHVEEALDPARNVDYAIRFLHRLRARNGNWAQAIADYHSGEPGRGLAYHRRVVTAGRGTGMEGGAVALPVRATAGLCAPGLHAVLVAGPAPSARRNAQRPRARLVCQRGRVEYAYAAPARGGRDQALFPLPPPSTRPAIQPARSVARPRAAAMTSTPALVGGRDAALLPLPPAPPSRQAAPRLSPRRIAIVKK